MGIFKERRPSLPAMNIKVPEVKPLKEVAILDTEFVIRSATSAGVDILAEIEAGRCLARLEPCPGDSSLYCLRLASDIPTLPLKTSCTHRSFSDWYFLQRTLQNLFPQTKIKELPPRRVLWIKRPQLKLEEIATFLQNIVSNKNFVHSRIIQLFLQSNLSTEFIQENVDGKRNDEVNTVPRIPLLDFNSDNDTTKVIKRITDLSMDDISVTMKNAQVTYHGPAYSNHKSVQSLFNGKRKSLIHNHNNHMQSLTEDSITKQDRSRQKQERSMTDPDKKYRNNSSIIY